MSGAGEVICEGWLRKSPPEKKLRRYAWKRRWFVLRSGRLSGEPDVLQYYKNQQSRRPIRTINLHLCEQVDAGLTFTKKELESSFVFDLRTEERVWYLVSESEEDMNRWVSCICLLCGFNPTEEVPERPAVSGSASIAAMTPPLRNVTCVTPVTRLVPPPYDPVNVRNLQHDGNKEEEYQWLSQCHTRPPLGSSTSLEPDDFPPPSSSSSSSSSPSLLPNGLPPSSSSPSSSSSSSPFVTSELQRRKLRCHPSPHPRKHSLDLLLRPVDILPLCDSLFLPQTLSYSGYQIPRLPSFSSPNVESLTPTPPPRPPKPQSAAAQEESSSWGRGRATLPRERERREEGREGGGEETRSNTITDHTDLISGSLSDRASMFEFSECFNSYFMNKGLVPLGSEDEDVDENYVPMSAAPTEPPVAPRAPPPPRSDSPPLQDTNYVPMTPLPPSLPLSPPPASGELASLGRQVPPPAHLGFRNSPLSPLSPLTPLTPPLRRNTTAGGEAVPPPIHRNLKPQRRGVSQSAERTDSQSAERTDSQSAAEPRHRTRVKPAPLDLPLQQDWQEVPPPVRSPVTRTFTRDPSTLPPLRPPSAHSSSPPSSDSDEPDENYVAMTTTSSLSSSTGETTLRLMLHRSSEVGVSNSSVLRRAGGEKQVEYLDLDLNTGRACAARQKRCTAEGGSDQSVSGEERARGGRVRVDYVVVDPKRTKALRSTREAWHDGRMSTEKEKC
ncbi:GRB2-associated-binding protein 1-like [Trematomus bernacchii]|uniref:GRB2-associated-binding protein 1-like n=1 Tax=Trematomus bernacchii TaxID=40690 RepID=UPI00146F163B|nr:GRB2-associated-binding protein 1-like [Trematomus bernacchii]